VWRGPSHHCAGRARRGDHEQGAQHRSASKLLRAVLAIFHPNLKRLTHRWYITGRPPTSRSPRSWQTSSAQSEMGMRRTAHHHWGCSPRVRSWPQQLPLGWSRCCVVDGTSNCCRTIFRRIHWTHCASTGTALPNFRRHHYLQACDACQSSVTHHHSNLGSNGLHID